MTNEEALAAFEKELVRLNRSPATVKILLATARRFLGFVRKPVARVTPEAVRRYLASRSETVAVTTTAAELWHLRSFFRAIGLEKNPTEGVTTKKGSHPPQLLLGSETVRKLLGAATERPRRDGPLWRALALRDRAVLELLYGVGLRASEVSKAQVVDVSLADAAIMVRRAKRGESRRLPLPPAPVEALARYLEEARPFLARRARDEGALVLTYVGTPIVRGDVWALVAKVAKAAGVHAYPHALRRALATGLVRAGVAVRAVQILLGHQSLETTQHYVGVDRDDLRAAVDLLDGST